MCIFIHHGGQRRGRWTVNNHLIVDHSNVENLLKLKTHENITSLCFFFQLFNHFEILHRAWQWYCHALCKISKLLDNWNRWFEFLVRFELMMSFGRDFPYCNWTHGTAELTPAEIHYEMSNLAIVHWAQIHDAMRHTKAINAKWWLTCQVLWGMFSSRG